MSETQKAGSMHSLTQKKPLQTNYENSELILVSCPAMGDTAEPCHYRNNKTRINKIMIQTISLPSQTHGQLPFYYLSENAK
jgi:hypothetical protein